MPARIPAALLAAAFLAALPLGAAEPAPKLERIEWSDIWITDADRDAGPRVLLVGDSIVRGTMTAWRRRRRGRPPARATRPRSFSAIRTTPGSWA
jgi:hypothetical protein